MTQQEIDRQWRLFGSVIPSTSEAPKLRRTAYFYRKTALGFLRSARHCWASDMRATCLTLAKQYLREYRQRKGPLAA